MSNKGQKSDFNTFNILHCSYCNKECHSKNSLKQHECRCKNNPNRRAYAQLANSGLILKGQTKETSARVAKATATLKEGYASGRITSWMKGKPGTFRGKHHTEYSKMQISRHTSISRKKGYASGTITPAAGVGRGKYSYIITSTHKYMLRSTYEFIFALYLLKIKNTTFELEAVRVPAARKNTYADTFLSDFSIGNTVIEIKGIAGGKDSYIKESFEAAGYKFIELFHESINKLKIELINAGIDVNSLLKRVVEGHNSKKYFVYNLCHEM